MATTEYGPYKGGQSSGMVTQRAYLTYETSSTQTDVTITVTSGIQQWNSNWNTDIKSYCTLGATGFSTSTSLLTTGGSYSSGGHLYPHFSSKTFTYHRGTSDAKKTITATSCLRSQDIPTSVISNNYGRAEVIDQDSIISKEFTIPAKTSYTISYNANGGTWTGTQPSDKKWYGDPITTAAASTVTRSGYTFAGWKWENTGSIVGAGQSWNDQNQTGTFYAQWTKNYVIKAKVNGTWKDTLPYCKVNDTWHAVSKIYCKINGTWKEI